MNKEEWQSLYNKLNNIYNEFRLVYLEFKYGSNEKIRSTAERKLRPIISRAVFLITNNEDAFQLMLLDNSETGRIGFLDEFKSPNYFESDLSHFLYLINEKIKTL